MSDKKHLNLDLDFLGKEGPEKSKPVHKISAEAATKKKADSRFYLILFSAIGGILLLVGLSSLAEDSSSISTDSTNEDSNVIVGDYSCSRYDSDKADSLGPSSYTENQIATEKIALQSLADEIDDLASEIENTYVNMESQYSIDSYNALVDDHNQKLIEYDNDSDALNVKIDSFNAKVAAYNNYLEAHCSKY